MLIIFQVHTYVYTYQNKWTPSFEGVLRVHWVPESSPWNFLVGGLNKLHMEAVGDKSNHTHCSATKIPFFPSFLSWLLRNLAIFRVGLEGEETRSALLQPFGKQPLILPFIVILLSPPLGIGEVRPQGSRAGWRLRGKRPRKSCLVCVCSKSQVKVSDALRTYVLPGEAHKSSASEWRQCIHMSHFLYILCSESTITKASLPRNWVLRLLS